MERSKESGLPVSLGGYSAGRVLRLKDVQALLGVGRSTIYDWLSQKSPRYNDAFPRPIKLSTTSRGAIGWLEADLVRWVESCKTFAVNT